MLKRFAFVAVWLFLAVIIFPVTAASWQDSLSMQGRVTTGQWEITKINKNAPASIQVGGDELLQNTETPPGESPNAEEQNDTVIDEQEGASRDEDANEAVENKEEITGEEDSSNETNESQETETPQ